MAILNKSDLAVEVSQSSGLSNSDAKLAIDKLSELIARHLADGDEVNVPGLGKFTVIDRAAHQGRTPRPARRFRSPLPRHPSSRPPAP